MADHLTLAAFTAAAHIWSAGYGDRLSQYLGSVALHPDGGVASVGSFTGSIDFGGGPMTTAPDVVDMFLVRLDASASTSGAAASRW